MECSLKEQLGVVVPTVALFNQGEAKVSNPSFHPVAVRIMAIDTIANRIKFSEQSTLNALPSLDNIPIVTNYREDEDNFGDHEMYKDENGIYRYNTYSIGVIPESANKWIEKVIDSEGIERTYLCADGLLWKRQHKEFAKIKEMEQMSVSMEVQITKGKFSEDKVLNVSDFYFTAIAVLGEGVRPAFRDAMISTFTEQLEYQQMMSELKEYMQQFEGGNNMAKHVFNEGEGGESATATGTVAEPSAEPNANPAPQEGEPDNVKTGEGENPEPTADPVDPTDPTEPVEDYQAKYLELQESLKNAEVEYGRTIADLTGAKQALEAQLEALQADMETKVQSVTQELEELRAYKATIEKEQNESARREVLERFGDLQEVEEYQQLLANQENYTPKQLEDECFIIVGKQARAGKKPSKVTPASTRIPVTTPVANKPRLDDGFNGLLLKRK